MRCLGQMLGFMLLVTLVVWIPCALYVGVSWGFMSNENTYSNLDREFYENLRPLVIPAFLEAEIHAAQDNSQTQEGLLLLQSAIENTDAETWQNISADLISLDRVQEQFEDNASIVVEYFNDDREFFDVRFNTAVLRQTLGGPAGEQAVTRMIGSWESCSPTQETQVSSYLAGETDSLPYCQPRNPELRQTLQTRLQGAVGLLANTLPDQFILRDQIVNEEETTLADVDKSFENARKVALSVERLLPLGFLVTVMLLALLVIVAVRSAKDFFLWTGLTFAISGLFVFVPLFAWLSNLVSSPEPFTNNLLEQLAGEAIIAFQRSIAQEMLGVLGVLGIGMLIMGVVGIVIAAVLRGPTDEPEQQMFYLTPNPAYTPTPMPQMMPPMPSTPHVPPTPTPHPRPTPPPDPRLVTPPPMPAPPTDSQERQVRVDFADDVTITPSDSNPFKDEEKPS